MSLMPGQYNLDPMIIGAIWDHPSFAIADANGAKDLTDCVVEMPIYDKNGDLVETLVDGDGLSLSRTAGIIAPIRSVAEVLSTYSRGLYSYALWITESDGLDKNLWIEGTVEVR